MSMFSAIFKALSTPDSQNRDWYAWASNQCSHALFGVFIAVLYPTNPFLMTFIIASLKETFDIARITTFNTMKDSLIDVSFWMVGASVVTLQDPVIGIFFMIAFLLMGIVQRLRNPF